jgi:glycosyltransferase involved in cell wall biosynthesis
MTPTPMVSVLLTAYNRERYIRAAIESVLAQTFTDFELIVSDDRSHDATVAVAEEYARRDPRVRVVVNERNLGDYPNRRQAASLARGTYLKFHDSDDIMYPHCLDTMVRALECEPRAAFALSGSHHWPGGPCPMLLTPKLAYEREFLGSGLFHLGPAGAMFRAAAFRELGGFPTAGVASDYLFWLDACARVNVLLVPADLFYYRIHSGQELSARGVETEYANAARVAWVKLHADECPLDDVSREQAKRNFVYVQARGIVRRLRRGNFAAAAAILRHVGLGTSAWLRYLRPPRRTNVAGTPVTTS